jgi:hypothetical protein
MGKKKPGKEIQHPHGLLHHKLSTKVFTLFELAMVKTAPLILLYKTLVISSNVVIHASYSQHSSWEAKG